MKRQYILLLVMLSSSFVSKAQDPKSIFHGSYTKCSAIQNGSYHGKFIAKPLMTSDTIYGTETFVFERLPGDTIYDWKFHNQSYYLGNYEGEALYTGNYLVYFNPLDSTGKSTSRELYPAHMKQLLGWGVIYPPFDPRRQSPFPVDSVYTDTANAFEFLGYEKIEGYTCYHIRLTDTHKINMSDQLKRIINVTDFWLNKLDSIPVQYTTFAKYLHKGDTTDEFSKQTLDAYQLNNLKDTLPLTLASIPAYCRLKEYAPGKPKELLPIGATAPDWSLRSIDNKEISLNGLRGHPVLIDFFYKSCLPCIDALPVTIGLNERYKTQGLRVIGFDPFDKNGKSLTDFLKYRNIHYPVMLDGTANNAYHVSLYPTLYLLDKEGKVIFSKVGIGEGDEKKLDELIRQNL